jgi:ketosteroid isomerase-like protein
MPIRTGLVVLVMALAAGAAAESNGELKEQVRKAESGFAGTMAKRDHAAFTSYLAEDALFFGSDSVQRGKAAVAAAWKPFFEKPEAPFSWEPAEVEVLDSGALAMTSGPVYDADGKRFGTFNSVWRRGKDGSWKVVLDKGCPACDCGGAAAAKPRTEP